MKAVIQKSRLSGVLSAPPSKSCAHRALICAALAGRGSTVGNIAFSEDIKATIDCIKALGAELEICGNDIKINGISGKTDKEAPPDKDKTLSGGNSREVPAVLFPCRESGSTLRFFIPIALTVYGKCFFGGSERLLQRGIGVYESVFSQNSVRMTKCENGIELCGRLMPGEYTLPGNVSSQYISGLLFALPLLGGDSVLKVLPPVESGAYIDITLDMLKKFGIEIEKTDGNVFYIKGNQKYRSTDVSVEGDWSNAAFLLALNELGGNVTVNGLDSNSRQGDKKCVEYFRALKAGTPRIDISGTPDLAPVLFTLACAKNGAVFTGTKRLAIKESDRAAVMAEELRKFGAEVTVSENEVVIGQTTLRCPQENLDSHNDHRVVMSLSALALTTGGTITGAEAINKSYPDFFENIKALGAEVRLETE